MANFSFNFIQPISLNFFTRSRSRKHSSSRESENPGISQKNSNSNIKNWFGENLISSLSHLRCKFNSASAKKSDISKEVVISREISILQRPFSRIEDVLPNIDFVGDFIQSYLLRSTLSEEFKSDLKDKINAEQVEKYNRRVSVSSARTGSTRTVRVNLEKPDTSLRENNFPVEEMPSRSSVAGTISSTSTSSVRWNIFSAEETKKRANTTGNTNSSIPCLATIQENIQASEARVLSAFVDLVRRTP